MGNLQLKGESVCIDVQQLIHGTSKTFPTRWNISALFSVPCDAVIIKEVEIAG